MTRWESTSRSPLEQASSRGVGLAPVAFAANETAQFASFASGVAVSGSASTTLTGDANWAEIDLPTAFFTSNTWTGNDPSHCVDYGITLSYNLVPQTIRSCQSRAFSGDDTEGDGAFLFVDASTSAHSGDVITVSWGSGYTTTNSSLSGATVWVWDSANDVLVPVTLPEETTAAIPMWQQAIGRASATATCPDGYTDSWDTWPNGGKGGYVCNKFLPAYGS